MEPFVIEEKEDHVITSRMPETEEESWQLEIALRRLRAKKLDEAARKAIETGLRDKGGGCEKWQKESAGKN